MKSILTLLFLAIFLCSNQAIAQKVKIKNDVASVDGTDFLKWQRILASNEISISSLTSDTEEVSAMYLDYSDPTEVSSGNPDGKVRWIELYFSTLDLRFEISTRGSKGLVKFFLQNNVYVDGALNEENVQKLVKKYGMRFSENRPNGSINIIIND